MIRARCFVSCFVSTFAITANAFAGPYTEAGIPAADPSFKGWATGVASITRGPQDISDPTSALASFGDPLSALGTPDGTMGVVSLGDGGSATLTFAAPIRNGTGPDLAVFENGFASGLGFYAELGFVDASSDGVHYFRFPSVSLTQTTTQVGGFDTIDPTDVHNLAGKHAALTGTPFDLADLVGVSPLLDVNHVTSVRVTDVVGSIDPRYGSRDSLGNLINDPFTTPFASGGFDLDAIGAINVAVPEPTMVGVIGIFALKRRRGW